MNKENYLDSIINTIENSIESNTKKVVFINNHSNFVLPKNRILNALKSTNEYILLTHTFKSDVVQGPYEPFMDWIRQIYIEYYQNEISEEDFLKESGVYYNHMESITQQELLTQFEFWEVPYGYYDRYEGRSFHHR